MSSPVTRATAAPWHSPVAAERFLHMCIEHAPRWHDRGFVELLNEAQGLVDELDVVWMPEHRLREPGPEELAACTLLSEPGCWVVVVRYDAVQRALSGAFPEIWGIPFSASAPTWAMTGYVLNGAWGNPILPGQWLIDWMCLGDRARHNNTGRLANEFRLRVFEDDLKKMDGAIDDAVHDERIWDAEKVSVADESISKEEEREQFEKAEKYMELREMLRNMDRADTKMPEFEKLAAGG